MMAFRPAASSLLTMSTRFSIFSLSQKVSSSHYHHQVAVRTLFSIRRNPADRRRRSTNSNSKKEPTLKQVAHMPCSTQEMDNQTIVALAATKDLRANEEYVKRHIMARDHIHYQQACSIFETIRAKNRQGMALLAVPYYVGMTVALTSAVVAIPMVFDLDTAQSFNNDYVTANVPPPEDLETMLETGSWAWSWMEPPLGTISFVLLALQFSRAQMQNLGIRPYTGAIKRWRGGRLARAFPQYDEDVLIQYSESTDILH